MKNLIVWLNSIINKHKALKRWRRVVTVLAAIMTFVTTYALILPAITVEKNKVEDVGGMYLEQEADTNDMLEENALEPIGVSIAAEHENAVTFAYTDDSMTATAVFGTNDEIPAGVELVVTPIEPESVEYTSLSSRAAELLDKEFIYDVTTCSFYDFALVLDDIDVTPKTGLVDIQIIFRENTVEHLDDTLFAGRFARSADDSSDVKDELVSVNPDESSVIELTDGIITALSLKGNDLSETDSLVGILAGNVDEEIKAAAAETDAEIPDSEDAQEESAQADSAGTDGEEAAPKVGTLKASGSDYTVTLTYDATSEIPEGASLTVSEIAQNSKEYKKYLEETKKAMGLTEEETLPQYAARFFDIKIMVGGDEFVPESGVTVEIAYTEPLAANPETEVNAVHFHNDTTEPEVIEANVTEISSDGTSNVEFTAEAFSVYGVVYTVDFHYSLNGKMYHFSIPGGGFVTLQQLVEVLGIAHSEAYSENASNNEVNRGDLYTGADDDSEGREQSLNNLDTYLDIEISDKTRDFVANVESVEFSSPDLVWVKKIVEVSTVGGLKEANGLECQYSDELTEEQIAEINAQTVESGEWALISILPFESEESLIVTMKSGEVFTIRITDAYNTPVKLHFVKEDGTPLTSITYDDETINVGNDGVFTLTADWLNQHLGTNGGELDLTQFVNADGYTLSNTHKSQIGDLYSSGNYPHTIIGNELNWDNNTLQYKLYYSNHDKAGWWWFDAGTQPKLDDDHWKHAAHNADGTMNGLDTDETHYSDPIFKDSVADNVYDYYLVYSPPVTSGSGTGGGSQTLKPENLDSIGKSKELRSNNDGTYTMDLSVTTHALPHEDETGVNLIIVFDTSSSMGRNVNNRYQRVGKDDSRSRFQQTVGAMNSFFEGLYEDAADPNSIKLALVDFNLIGQHRTINGSSWTSDYEAFMTTVSNLSITSGTNWADGLQQAINTVPDPGNDNPTYVLLMTDGAPSQYWHSNKSYFVGGEGCYLGARDEARAVVNDGKELFAIFSYGDEQDQQNSYLTKLVNYAYNSNKQDHSYYAGSTAELESALASVLEALSAKIGHTNVNYYDGIALDTTSTALKINGSGNLGSITYSKIGGTSANYTVTANSDGTIKSFTVGGAPDPTTGRWTGGTSYDTGTIENISYNKITGGTPDGEGGKTDISLEEVEAPVYQCIVATGDNAGTYNMPIATLATRDTNGDGKTDVGDLNWDLSPLGMLEDGATYKISFVVWPDQEAYDYVADLNNGKKEWNKDTQIAYPEGASEEDAQYLKNGVPQYPNIVYNPTTKLYEVLTNTAQEVTYYIEDQISGGSDDEPYSGVYTVEPEQPNPMPLTSTQTDIEKAWGVNRNPSTLAQLLYDNEGNSKNFSINYAIIRGDSEEPYMEMTLGWDDKQKKYIWEEDSVQTVFLDNNGVDVPVEVGTRWSEDFAITTGLMLSETQMLAHGLDTTGANYPYYTYKGTKYYILEPGYDYTIEEIVPDYAESWLTYEFDFIAPVYHPMLVDGKLKSVTFKMDQGEITGISDISRDDWRVSLEIENTLRGYINLKKIVVGKDGTTLKPDDETKFTYHISMANYATKPGPFRGDSIPWYGVNGLFYHDSDYNYYQAETHTDNNKAYSFELKAEDGTVYQAHCADPDGIFDEDVPGPTAITYTKGEGDDAEEVTILLFGNEMNMTDSNNVWADLRISQKEELSIANVPNGTRYTITEVLQEGYDVKDITREVMKGTTLEESSTISGRDTITAVIVPDRDNNITFKNRERSLDVSFDKVDGNGKALPGAAFTLYSDETCETIAKDLYNEDLVAVSKSNGKVCFGEMANGTYYMKETAAPEGYEPDETVYKVVVTAGSGQSKQVSITKLDAPEEGEITQIANPKKEITLSVEKTWLDADGNEIVNTDEYYATFTAHRKMTYTTTEMQGEEPGGDATLRIGYYYQWGGYQYAIFNEFTKSYGAGQTVNISYSYTNNYYTRGYMINNGGSTRPLTSQSGTVPITMPAVGETVTVYFYDQPDYWGNGHISINSVEPVVTQVSVEVTHENEEDESFHPTLTLSGGNTSGTFEGTFPVEETKEGVTYYYTYYITEEPVDGFMTTPSVSGYSNDADLTAQFTNQKIPHPTPVDVNVDELPEHHKELTENYVDGKWDGTYTLSLDVTGKAASTEASTGNNVDIILVLDMSSSMSNKVSGDDTRFDLEIDSVRGFGTELLELNNSVSDSVHLSVLTFGNVVNAPLITETSSITAFEQALNSLVCPPPETTPLNEGGQGTNWESALAAANHIHTREDAEKIVIFVSDGNPTLRDTRGEECDENTEWGGATMEERRHHNTLGTGFADNGYDVWGFGYDKVTDQLLAENPVLSLVNPENVQAYVDYSVGRCYYRGSLKAREIVNSGKEFYSISVFETIPRMEQLVAYAYSESNDGTYPAGHYHTADTAGNLSSIFSSIVQTASKAVDFRNVKISDPLTAATKTIASVDGSPVDFKYWKVTKDEEGHETAVEWTGGPKAKYTGNGTGGAIEWDVSAQVDENGTALEDSEDFDKGRLKDGALENDVTYRVTFTVWPNQDAYDAVLRLNEVGNDHEAAAQILAEYPDIADQIIKDHETGKYRIYSNGDATLKYTQYTSTNGGDPVPGEEQTLYYPRPTMETLQYKMKVKKIWNDSIFPNHRVEKVKFDIKEDGKYYHTVILDSRNMSVRDPHIWEAEIPVSPGIESDQIVNGEKLNEGHVYTVTESFLIDGKWVAQDYHYEFDPESITPLLLNGEMGYEGDTNGDNALTGTNNARGSVTILKKLVDNKGTDITEDLPNDEFTFKVTLYAPGADGTEIIEKTEESDDAVWYNKFDRDGDIIGQAGVINSGDTFTLKAGESFRLINVPIGIKYSVEEVPSSMPEGFEFVSMDYTYKTGSDGTEQTQTPTNSLYTVIANTWHYVTVKNKVDGNTGFSFSKSWLVENAVMTEIQEEHLKDWANGNTISVTIRRIANGESEPDETFSLSYVIGSGAGPFKPSNPGMAEEDKTEYQLTKTVSDKITTFTMGDVLENEDQNGKTYTYYVEEVSATGGAGILYNTYYGNVSEGSIVWRPDAKHAGDGEVIINLEYSGYELPSTGGQGTRLFYLVGCLLTVLAGAGLVMKKKLKESV